MEALGLLSGCSSNPTLQTSLILPMSVSSFLQRNYGNPLKIKALVALPRTAWKGCLNRLQYCNAIGKLNDSTALEVTTDWEKPQLRRKRLAVFVSGGGSNFMSIHEACLQGSVHGDIVVLVTNKAGCGGAEFAKKMGIPVILFPRTKHEPGGQSTSDLVSTFGRFGVDFILLAGYLKLIPVELIHAYPRSIVNIHPSLLPAFGGKGYYGMRVHKAVITSGARYSGPTIHFVDEHYDEGRILAQRVVPVQANDTAEELASRVLEVEHQLYVEVAAALCEERIHWRDDGVPIIRSRENPDKYS